MIRNNGFHNRHSPFNRAFNPASLFTNGEQGWVYDPSNFATLFQDSAGTTPVTAVEQPVGLQLDLSQNGVGANGAARYNLLNYSQEFDNASWTNTGSTVTPNATVAPDGTLTADALFETAGVGIHRITQNAVAPINTNCKVSVSLKPNGRTWAIVVLGGGGNGYYFDLSNLIVGNETGGTGTVSNPLILLESNGWVRVSFNFISSDSRGIEVFTSTGNGQFSFAGDPTKGIYIWGADIRLTSQAALNPTYQPIAASWTASIPGNHRFQATSANRPVVSARVNLLTKTEDISDAAWTKLGATVSSTDTIVATAAFGAVYETVSKIGSAIQYTLTVEFAAGTVSAARLTLAESTISTAGVGCDFTLTGAGVAGTPAAYGIGGWVAGSATIVSVGDGWYRCTLTATSSTTGNISGVAGHTGSAIVGNTVKARKTDLRVTNQGVGLPVYQRVNTSTDYDSTGFPVYLKANGSNQSMATNSINFTATNKMTVWQGVRKLNDASGAILVELSANIASNNGSFYISAPENSTNYGFRVRGLTGPGGYDPSTFTAPITNVVAVSFDTTAATTPTAVIPRLNGVVNQTGLANVPPGGGNFGNYPAYFYARAGTSVYFTGNDYASIARGAASTTTQITDGETWVNSKTKAY